MATTYRYNTCQSPSIFQVSIQSSQQLYRFGLFAGKKWPLLGWLLCSVHGNNIRKQLYCKFHDNQPRINAILADKCSCCYGNWLIELKNCLLLGWLLGRYHDNHLKTSARLSCTNVASLVEIGSYICLPAQK